MDLGWRSFPTPAAWFFALALMLRSIAAECECSCSHSRSALRCVSKHEGARHRPVLILRDARTLVRLCGSACACALLRMRTASRFSPAHDVQQPISFPRRMSAPGGFALCFAHPELRGGRSAERRSGACGAPVEPAHDAAGQALARRLASHDAAIYGPK